MLHSYWPITMSIFLLNGFSCGFGQQEKDIFNAFTEWDMALY